MLTWRRVTGVLLAVALLMGLLVAVSFAQTQPESEQMVRVATLHTGVTAPQHAAKHVLSGRVTDAATHWPLYASLDIDGFPGDPVWTDPETGFYSVTLPAHTAYTIHTSAWVDGYHAASREVAPLVADRTENFDLAVDAEACIAPGYQISITGMHEPFENGGLLPAGWDVVDHLGNGQVWRFDDPGERGNETGGTGDFAIIDSDYYGSGEQQDTELRSPSLDFRDLASVVIEFDTYYQRTLTSSDIADVDVSTNDGQSWTNVWRKAASSSYGPAHEVVDISAAAAGRPDVMVRFRYYDAEWAFYWQVDNVLVGQNRGCQPRRGGLIVGNVYDDNTGSPLVGAEVANDVGESATALATPLDPDVSDALYILVSPAGSHTVTAVAGGGYGPGVETVAVIEEGAVRQDFSLAAGWLAYEPESIDVTVARGRSTSVPLRLSNQGGVSLDFEIVEIEGGVVPEGASPSAEVTIPAAVLTYGPNAKVAAERTVLRPEMSFVVEQVWRPSGSLNVLLLTPDAATGGDISPTRTTLTAFPDLNVTLWDAAAGDPTGADLATYDVVIVGNQSRWTEAGMTAAAVGDALADYIDGGGKVVDTMQIHDYGGWQLGGRYITGGYAPFTASTTDRSDMPYFLATVYDSAHPIMDGVSAIKDHPTTESAHQDVGLAAGATRLADWNDGEVFIAYNDDVVGVNQVWFHGAHWTGDMPALMHNIILYLARGDVDWLSTELSSGTIAAAGELPVLVTFDASAPSMTQPGVYHALLQLRNDTPYGNPAVPLTMAVVAAPIRIHLPIVAKD